VPKMTAIFLGVISIGFKDKNKSEKIPSIFYIMVIEERTLS